MNPKLKEYLVNTLLVQTFTILVLTPWLILSIGITFEQWLTWLWQSTLIAFVYGHGVVLWIRYWTKKGGLCLIKKHKFDNLVINHLFEKKDRGIKTIGYCLQCGGCFWLIKRKDNKSFRVKRVYSLRE